MSDLVTIALREVLFLVVIVACGSGPAAHLPEHFPRSSRYLLAPVIGLCTGMSFFTTIEWFIDGSSARWLVPVVALVSLAVAVHRRGFFRSRTSQSAGQTIRRALLRALQAALICFAVSFPTALMLSDAHSIGPTAYEVYDAPGYVANVDGAQAMSIGHVYHSTGKVQSFVIAHWVNQVRSNNRLDIAPFAAALNSLVGLEGTQTWAAYLLAVLAAGGLALCGAIGIAVGRPTWYGVIAGGLFGCGFFLQLFMDSSQAAIIGISLIAPLLVLVFECAETFTLPVAVTTAIIIAGLITAYPILLFPVAVTTVLFVLFRTGQFTRWSLRAWTGEFIRSCAFGISILIVGSLISILATVRNLPVWWSLLHGGGTSIGQPQYHLGIGVVAGWLLQVRDFYSVTYGSQSTMSNFLPAILVPIGVLCLIVAGVWRNRCLLVAATFVVVSAVTATKEVATNSCSYCEDRSLLPIVPAILLLAFGALADSHLRNAWQHLPRVLIVGAYLSFVGVSLNRERNLFSQNGVFLNDAVRTATSHIATNGPTQIEGFGAAGFPASLAEQALPYEVLIEAHQGTVSILAQEENSGITASFGPTSLLRSKSFQSNYQYVLTRLPEVITRRETIWSGSDIALEKRVTPTDATVIAGVGVPANPAASQEAEVNGTLQFVVSNTLASTPPKSLEVELRLPTPTTTFVRQPGTHYRTRGTLLDVCVPLGGLKSNESTAAVTGIPANVGVTLHAMFARPRRCR